jgi:hypothetical protein
MKPVLVLVLLFLASAVAIVAGYSELDQLFDASNWSRVVRAVPVLSTALIVAGGTLVVLLLAFWLCRGSRATYENAVLGYSYFAPFIIVLVFLPGAQSKPDWTPLNHGTMLTLLVIAQVASTYSLRSWFWSRGARTEA